MFRIFFNWVSNTSLTKESIQRRKKKNGSGKSTLLKLIANIIRPTNGEIKVTGKITSFLELGIGFAGDLTAKDNIYVYGILMGLTPKEIHDKFDDIIEFAGIEKFVDTNVNMKAQNGKPKSWLKLFAGIFIIILFLFVIGPLYLNLPLVRQITEVIEKEDIEATAFYYTELEGFAEAEAAIKDSMNYSPGK